MLASPTGLRRVWAQPLGTTRRRLPFSRRRTAARPPTRPVRLPHRRSPGRTAGTSARRGRAAPPTAPAADRFRRSGLAGASSSPCPLCSACSELSSPHLHRPLFCRYRGTTAGRRPASSSDPAPSVDDHQLNVPTRRQHTGGIDGRGRLPQEARQTGIDRQYQSSRESNR